MEATLNPYQEISTLANTLRQQRSPQCIQTAEQFETIFTAGISALEERLKPPAPPEASADKSGTEKKEEGKSS